MQQYRCPVCKKPLTKKEYEAALGILSEREAHLKHREEELKGKEAALRKTKADLLAKAKEAKTEGLAQGKKKERERAERLMAGQKGKIAKLQERIQQLEKGSTPQTEGLEFEATLTERLQKAFRSDVIKHEGKSGDILHRVCFAEREVGLIVYECKRTPSIPTTHVQQAFRAKQERQADYAVLVTTGTRQGFSGFAEAGGVLIVSPLGVPALAELLRSTLIEMFKAKVAKGKRAAIATELLSFISSPQFRNPIEEAITRTAQLQGLLREEARQHARIWQQRYAHYQWISWDSSSVKDNIQLVLSGKDPQKRLPPEIKLPPLLPEPSS